MNLLCLDCGNSRAKWGLRGPGDGWMQLGSAGYGELPELAVAATRVVACNVAGDKGLRAAEALAVRLGAPVEWLRANAAQCGVINGYEPPEQLGADRWAALIGARSLHRGSCLVVSAGTATTIDVLDASGRFRGGLILPGLTLMREALAAGTADLPAGGGALRDLPTNTFDAIASGAMSATLGAIERQFRLIADAPAPMCLLTGGNAPLLRPNLALDSRFEPDLILAGLAVAALASRQQAG